MERANKKAEMEKERKRASGKGELMMLEFCEKVG